MHPEEIEGEDESEELWRTVRVEDVGELGTFIGQLTGATEPLVIVAPDGARAIIMPEALHDKLLDRLEDAEDSLYALRARVANEPTVPFEDVMREHMPERLTHVSD